MEKIITKKDEVSIEWTVISNKNCLRITFFGVLTKQEATRAAMRWAEAMEMTSGKTIVIFECRNMTDYEPQARMIWSDVIKRLANKTACIWVVTESKLISAGAAILGLFSPVKIRTTNSEVNIAFD